MTQYLFSPAVAEILKQQTKEFNVPIPHAYLLSPQGQWTHSWCTAALIPSLDRGLPRDHILLPEPQRLAICLGADCPQPTLLAQAPGLQFKLLG